VWEAGVFAFVGDWAFLTWLLLAGALYLAWRRRRRSLRRRSSKSDDWAASSSSWWDRGGPKKRRSMRDLDV
jgi:membrane protein implicated in regulation of membrane protease activity